MGIPHLITHLQPYASLSPLQGDAVIDGPALAYHVYWIALQARPQARNPLEATPTYHEIGRTAIAWLEGIESHGITIKQIYFDGYLPVTKLPTRLDRLRSSTKKLLAYHAMNATACEASPPAIHPVWGSPFGQVISQRRHTSLTPAALLVPAVLDALNASPIFGSKTIVVPGEADLYCAWFVKNHGGTVLTGDSDLLVHELGRGSVTFFKDIQSHDCSLRSYVYNPKQIASDLKVHSILPLAWSMKDDVHLTLPQHVARSAHAANDIRGYAEFSGEYASLTHYPSIASTPLLSALQSLDPRLSEFALHFGTISTIAGLPMQMSRSDTAHIFLPFLLDCPARTNAWESSTPTRLLAYGLMNLIVPVSEQMSTVTEHRRMSENPRSTSGPGLSGREWVLPSHAEIISSSEEVVNEMNSVTKDHWLRIAIHQDERWAMDLGKQPLSRVVAAELGGKSGNKVRSWDMQHLLAQVQGSWYSFRILKQIISVVLAFPGSEIPSVVKIMGDLLAKLPSLDSTDSVVQNDEELKRLVECSETSTEPIKSKAKKKRKRKNSASKVDAKALERDSNPFSLLAI